MRKKQQRFSGRILFSIAICIAVFASCARIEKLEQRMDENESQISLLGKRIDDLSDAMAALEEAYRGGKVITDVSGTDRGWKILFSDGSSIDVINGTDGKDGTTPVLKIDAEGFFCVSYDKGVTFSLLLDENGNPILAHGDGLCVRVVELEGGRYAFESYYPSNPDEVVSRTVTPFTNTPGTIISSIVEDPVSKTITLTMADGSFFTFPKTVKTPSSIVIVSAPEIFLSSGSSASIIFRVNPSDASFSCDPASGDGVLSLDRTAVISRSGTGYITSPSHYALESVKSVYDENGVMLQGQYEAIVKDLGTSSSYDEMLALVLSIGEGDHQVQLSSSAIRVRFCSNLITSFAFLKEDNEDCLAGDVYGSVSGHEIVVSAPYISDLTHLVARFETAAGEVYTSQGLQVSGFSPNDFSSPVTYLLRSAGFADERYVVKVSRSGLPAVIIDTKGQLLDTKDPWREGCDIRILSPDGTELYSSNSLQIKGRGNLSWSDYPKKPYALKLEKKAEILGMPKHKRWCLLSNWPDKTLMRNYAAFEISRVTDLEWTPQGRYVELFLNGQFLGNYFLCEQVRVDENRVNIEEMKKTDVSGDALTGGYLMEMDSYFDEVNKFRSSFKNMPYNFKSPDEDVLGPEQFEYMQGYVNALEASLYQEGTTEEKWEDYLDAGTWADMFLVQELTGNWEPNHPKSFYVYKPRLGKLKAGPAWDFDFWTFSRNYTARFAIDHAVYYDRLLEDPVFVQVLKDHWNQHLADFLAVPDRIRAMALQLEESSRINSRMWTVPDGWAPDWNMDFAEAVESLIDCYLDKLEWMESRINSL